MQVAREALSDAALALEDIRVSPLNEHVLGSVKHCVRLARQHLERMRPE